MKNEKCHACGATPLVESTTTMKRAFGEQVYTAELPATACPACGEAVVEGDVLARYDAALTHALVRHGQPGAAAVKWLRKAARLTGAELAALLGVTPESVSRWENDRTAMDRATWVTLGALAIEAEEGRSDTADMLRARAEPRKPVVRVSLAFA